MVFDGLGTMDTKSLGRKECCSMTQVIYEYQAKTDRVLLDAIQTYWNSHIHDLAIATEPVGSSGFFQELDAYRFEKLSYLPCVVDFSAYRGKRLLEVGCGAGLDLVRFAKGGAITTGVDLSPTAIELARANFEQNGLKGEFYVMNGEALDFDSDSYDVVYAHGVLQYTASPRRMVDELYRVLCPGGVAILMVYNRYSWLNGLSKFMKVELEHEDAPVFCTFSLGELRKLLEPFKSNKIIHERFPVKTKLQRGMKAKMFNELFVGTFNRLPKSWVRPLGWHLMAFAYK
jgi:SAM-dependent methyltransferase